MIKSVSGNYYYYLIILVLAAFVLIAPRNLFSQGYLKAELRNTNCAVASHEADRWFFGQNAGLDFRPQDPEADLTNYLLNVPTSPAVMADSMGNILFYTDGTKVYDRLGQQMPNGDGLHGSYFSTMPVIIIPKPGSDSIFYIFTTDRQKQYETDTIQAIYGLEYNEVDLSLNGGQGDVDTTKKNKVLLQPEVSSKLTAIKHSNGIDYWVIGHRYETNEFCSFLVTSDGVDPNYVSSSLGTVQVADTNNGFGYMKISPDGTKLALAIHGSDIYEIFNFDASTGRVTNAIVSSPVFNNAYGVEFSPDSRFLYGTTTPFNPPWSDTIPDSSYIFQFDVSLGGSIFNQVKAIALDTMGSYFGGIQLGTDGRIYVSRSPYGNASLSVIQNPKRPDTACNFKANALDLSGKKSHFGFPNFMQSYFDLPHFDVENICFADTTIFIPQNNSNIDTISWQFGDTASNANSSSAPQPYHVFSLPGSYTVKVTETYNGVAYGPYTETVDVNELPSVSIGDTVYMYPGSPILLDAGEGYVSYEWSTGENTQVVKITEPGTYWVTIQNELCCFNIATVLVIYFDVMVPNAFRPDGVNNIFKAYASSLEAINNFSMYIYNRWGQQIFVSNDITQGWDGKIKGKDAPGDVYVWLINYDVEREGKTKRIAYKGNVIILR